MALPKKQLKEKLSELGLPEENLASALEFILNGHTESTDALKEQIEALKEAQTQLDTVTKERNTLREQLEKAGDAAKVQAEFDAFKQQIEDEKTNAGKLQAVRKLLKESGIQRETFLDLLMDKVDAKSIELDEKGLIKDSKTFVDGYKSKYADLFAEIKDHGAEPHNPPSGGGHTAEELDAMSDEEYYKHVLGKKK